MRYSELDKLAKECEYEIDRNATRTKYRTRSNLIEIANDIPDIIYFSTSRCGFLDIEFFKKCIELAETPLKDREDEKDNLDAIINRLEDIIIDLEEYKEKQELPYEITDMQGMFSINNTDIPF